jgi:hypothetical protein
MGQLMQQGKVPLTAEGIPDLEAAYAMAVAEAGLVSESPKQQEQRDPISEAYWRTMLDAGFPKGTKCAVFKLGDLQRQRCDEADAAAVREAERVASTIPLVWEDPVLNMYQSEEWKKNCREHPGFDTRPDGTYDGTCAGHLRGGRPPKQPERRAAPARSSEYVAPVLEGAIKFAPAR